MNKRAQFFIVAALIISGGILGFNTYQNKAQGEGQQVRTYDLSQEINYEASQVIDNGVFNAQSPDTITANIKNLTAFYATRNPDSDIQILYGDEAHVQSIQFDGDTNQVEAISLSDQAQGEDAYIVTENEEAKIRLNVKLPKDKEGKEQAVTTRDFKLKKNQNLYVGVKRKVKNEQEFSVAG